MFVSFLHRRALIAKFFHVSESILCLWNRLIVYVDGAAFVQAGILSLVIICIIDASSVQRESQHVVFMLNPESNQFTYTDVLNRIQLRKTKVRRADAAYRALCAFGVLTRPFFVCADEWRGKAPPWSCCVPPRLL